MRTKTITLEQWDELTPEAQSSFAFKHRFINTPDGWWNEFCDEAGSVDVHIVGFDMDRTNNLHFRFEAPTEVIAGKIVTSHKKGSGTHNIARAYLHRMTEINGDKVYNESQKDDERESAEDVFTVELKREYWRQLKEIHRKLIDTDAVINTLRSKGYYFDEAGNIETPDEKPLETKPASFDKLPNAFVIRWADQMGYNTDTPANFNDVARELFARLYNEKYSTGEMDDTPHVVNVDETPEPQLTLYYVCPDCGHHWTDTWSCEVNGQCPNCGIKDIEPVDSDPND